MCFVVGLQKQENIALVQYYSSAIARKAKERMQQETKKLKRAKLEIPQSYFISTTKKFSRFHLKHVIEEFSLILQTNASSCKRAIK